MAGQKLIALFGSILLCAAPVCAQEYSGKPIQPYAPPYEEDASAVPALDAAAGRAYPAYYGYNTPIDPRRQTAIYNAQTAPQSTAAPAYYNAQPAPPAAVPTPAVTAAYLQQPAAPPNYRSYATSAYEAQPVPPQLPPPPQPRYQYRAAASSPPQAADERPLLAMSPPEPDMGLETRPGINVGLQGFYYKYREPNPVDVMENGGMGGFTADGTVTFGPGYFATLDARYALGDLSYRGSGTARDKFNDLWEVRGLVGKDFIFPRYSLSPYTGIGFRDLYDDNRGLTTTGAFGYRRINQIYYLPIGIEPRMPFDSKSRFTSLLEYDVLLHGSQTSHLEDGNAGDPRVENQQNSGFGIKANVMYETGWWSIGPYVNYWNIDRSQVKTVRDNNATTCASVGASAPCAASFVEPKNNTYELGLQVKFHFF